MEKKWEPSSSHIPGLALVLGGQTGSGWGYGETQSHWRTAGERASCGPPEAQLGVNLGSATSLLT